MKKINKALLNLITVLVISVGCASTPKPSFYAIGDLYESKEVNFPDLNKITKRGLGDTLISKGYKSYTPSITLLDDVEVLAGTSLYPRHYASRGTSGTIDSRLEVIRTGEEIACYSIAINYEAHWNWSNTPGKTLNNPLCKDSSGRFKWRSEFTVGEENGGMVKSYGAGNWSTNKVHVIPFNGNVKETQRVNTSTPGFVQEFIYNGRVENAIRFIYREFSEDYIKPSFTQEVQYDLNQSQVVGFKNLRIEIIEASNTEIEYKVLETF